MAEEGALISNFRSIGKSVFLSVVVDFPLRCGRLLNAPCDLSRCQQKPCFTADRTPAYRDLAYVMMERVYITLYHAFRQSPAQPHI